MMRASSSEALAQLFYEVYERLAPTYGHATRKEPAVLWADVPEKSKALMIAVCRELLNSEPDSLTSIFTRQLELQRASFGIDLPLKSERDTVEFLDWNVTAMAQELAEMRDEFAWKPWAKDRYEWVNRDAVIKEGIDVLHFLVNVWLSLGADVEEILARYMGKADVNAKRQSAGYTHDYMKEIDKEGVRRALDEPEIQQDNDLLHSGWMEFDDFDKVELLEAIRTGQSGLADLLDGDGDGESKSTVLSDPDTTVEEET
jgi:hypothetical protein